MHWFKIFVLGCLAICSISRPAAASGGDDEAKRKDQAQKHLIRAREAASEFKMDKASHEAGEALKDDPSLAEAHVYLGLPFLRAGDFQGAENEFRTAISLDNYLGLAHCYLGYVLYQKGAFDDAIDQLNFAAKIEANSPQILAGLGLAQLKLGDRDKAIKTYERALEYDRRYAELTFLSSEKGPHWTGPMLKDVADLLPLVHKPKYPY